MNRFDKLDYLIDNCSDTFVKHNLIKEMVDWMGENDFNEFFDHLCSHWDINHPFDNNIEDEELEEVYDEAN